MPDAFPWSRLEDARRAFRAGRPGFWSLPVVRKSEDLVADAARAGGSDARVLDVGAGDGALGRRLGGARYTTVDPDPGRDADHRTLDDVDGTFDVVACLEVIEHVPADDAIALLAAVRQRLAVGGRLVVSTPNTMNPTAFLTTVDHRTPWRWDELGGVLESLGYRVDRIVRVQNDPWLRRVGRRLVAPLHRVLGIDWAVSIAVVATRDGRSG